MNAHYKTARAKAWRKLLVAAINAGFEQGLIGLREGENHWTSARIPEDERGVIFDLTIGGMPAAGYLSDAGFGELSVHCALIPKDDRSFIGTDSARFRAGDAYTISWLERRHGAWLQCGRGPLFWCRKHLVDKIAALDIEAHGYADFGKPVM